MAEQNAIRTSSEWSYIRFEMVNMVNIKPAEHQSVIIVIVSMLETIHLL